jgi:hypothetical protein
LPAPSAPNANSVILQTGNGQNLVSWPIISGATSYTVQRAPDGVNFTTLASPTVNLYLDAAVLVGVQYWYQVAAVNGSGSSAFTPSAPVSIVPSTVGQISLGYLRYMSQLKADMINSTFLTTDEWNFGLNQSAYELYDILVTHFGDNYFLAPFLLITLTGNQSYPIPDGTNYPINGVNSPALYKLVGLDANVSGAAPGINAGWVPVARMNWSDRDRFTTFPGQAGALNNIYEMSYRPMGSQIFIFPPNVNQLLRMSYVPMLPQMLLDTDMMPFSISGWSEYVIVDMAIRALLKEESFDQAAALGQRKAALLERIETTASNRDAGEPNCVSNIRAVSGDPGFSGYGGGFGGGYGGGWGGGF